ncbi:MAG: F0F1 ATP synthase subunit B [Chloroflexota bacterium]
MEGLFSGLGINLPSLLAQLVNFLILFGVIYLFGRKRILRLLDERSGKVRESMEQAEAVKQQLANSEEEARKRIEAASKEGQDIIARATRTGEEMRQKAQQDARQEGETLINRAKSEIQRERDEAVTQLRGEFADLAIQAAEKVIERSLDKQAHRQLIDKVLEEADTLKKG